MSKSVLLLLVLVIVAQLGAACKNEPHCLKRGTFCYPGNWQDCCCYEGCLGLILGACFGTTEDVNGLATYVIKDEDGNQLTQGAHIIDKTVVASQAQLDKVIAQFGNRTLYMDAHIDYYRENEELHKSWLNHKIN